MPCVSNRGTGAIKRAAERTAGGRESLGHTASDTVALSKEETDLRLLPLGSLELLLQTNETFCCDPVHLAASLIRPL